MKLRNIIIPVVAVTCYCAMANMSLPDGQQSDANIQEIRVYLNRYLDVHRWAPRLSSEELKHKQSQARKLLQKIANGTMTPEIADDEAQSLITAASVFLRSPLDPEAFVTFYDLLQTSEDELIERLCVDFIQTMCSGVSLNINNTETVADLARRFTAGQFELPKYRRLVARILADSGNSAGREFLQSVVADTQIEPAERFRCALSLYAFDLEDNEVLGQMVDLLVDSDVSLNERYRYLVNLKRYGANVSERVVTTAMDSKNDSIRYHIGELLVVSGDVRGIAVVQSIAQNQNSEFATKAQELLSNRMSPNLDIMTSPEELLWDSKLRVFTKREQLLSE